MLFSSDIYIVAPSLLFYSQQPHFSPTFMSLLLFYFYSVTLGHISWEFFPTHRPAISVVFILNMFKSDPLFGIHALTYYRQKFNRSSCGVKYILYKRKRNIIRINLFFICRLVCFVIHFQAFGWQVPGNSRVATCSHLVCVWTVLCKFHDLNRYKTVSNVNYSVDYEN